MPSMYRVIRFVTLYHCAIRFVLFSRPFTKVDDEKFEGNNYLHDSKLLDLLFVLISGVFSEFKKGELEKLVSENRAFLPGQWDFSTVVPGTNLTVRQLMLR